MTRYMHTVQRTVTRYTNTVQRAVFYRGGEGSRSLRTVPTDLSDLSNYTMSDPRRY